MSAMLKRLSAAVIGAACLSGCASLEVKVDTLRPSYVRQIALDDSLRREAMAVLAGDQTQVDAFVRAQKRDYLDYRTRCLTSARDLAAAEAPVADRAGVVSSFNQAISEPGLLAQVDGLFSGLKTYLTDAERQTRQELESAGTGGLIASLDSRDLSATSRDTLLRRRARFTDAAASLYDVRAGQLPVCGQMVEQMTGEPPSGEAAAQAVALTTEATAKAQASARRVITGDGVLLLDRAEAWSVAGAPEEAWATNFNRATVTGFGGGTDIAIVMNSTGDYSVKGFTFDGRSTANMMSKVGGQALRLIATAYGATPIAGAGETTATGDSSGASTAALQSVLQQRAAQEAATLESSVYRAALFRLAETVLAHDDELITGDTAAEGAVSAALQHLNPWITPASTTP